MSETYRPASHLKVGDFIARADGSYREIKSVVQVESPIGMALVTLADGLVVNIPHTHEVEWRCGQQQKDGGAA